VKQPKRRLPKVSLVRQFDTHRLIPSKYSPGGASVLVRWPREKFKFEAPPQEDEIRSAVLDTGANASIATKQAAE